MLRQIRDDADWHAISLDFASHAGRVDALNNGMIRLADNQAFNVPTTIGG
jgi:hypothetical protein